MARKSKRKRKRVHPVLDHVLGDRVKTLEDTILSLLPFPPPPSPTDCQCGGSLCLICIGGPYLVDLQRDPDDYIALLRKTYCYLSPSAPSPPNIFTPLGHTQQKVVEETIKQLQVDPNSKNNLLRENSSHSSKEVLCSHPWDILLARIGDHLMNFLLKHTSIFIPPKNKCYQQVTGSPLTGKLKAAKRKRGTNTDKELQENVCVPVTDSNDSKPTRSRKRKRKFSLIHKQKRRKVMLNSNDVNNLVSHTVENNSHLPPLVPRGIKPRLGSKGFNHSERFPKCFNGFELWNTQNISPDDKIERKSMFQNNSLPKIIFRKDHILGKVEADVHGAALLLKHIFKLSIEDFRCICFRGPANSSHCLYHWLVRLLMSLIKKAKRCYHEKLVSKWEKITKVETERLTGGQFGNQQIILFVFSVIRSIIPSEFFGDERAMRALMSNIAKFLGLRKHESFSLSQCVDKHDVSHYKLLSYSRISRCLKYKIMKETRSFKRGKEKKSKFSDIIRDLQRQLLQRWLYWLYSDIILPLVSSFCYVTEKQGERNSIFYYAKHVWQELTSCEMERLNGTFEPLDSTKAEKIIFKRRFGISNIKMIPKGKGIRIVASTRRPFKLESRFVKSAYTVFKGLFAILKSIKQEHHDGFGSSVFGYGDIYKELSQFLLKLKGKTQQIPKVYIVVADIQNAFDSIDHEKLLGILKNMMDSDGYFLRHYDNISSKNKRIRTVSDQLACKDHGGGNHEIRFNSTGTSIIIDKGRSDYITKEKIHQLLEVHLKQHILRYNGTFYLQRVGICQGSSISSMLCSLYLGHLEMNIIFPFLQRVVNALYKKVDQLKDCIEPDRPLAPSYKLLRLTDDFLFISTSKQVAEEFYSRLLKGFRGYNCSMNATKFGLNFDFKKHEDIPNRRYTGADGSQFMPWCGLLINCHTLEIQADYTRYLNVHMSSTITVQLNGDIISILGDKLQQYMLPKCHPIFYDSNINSPTIVRLNAYQAFLLCAMKFHCYFRIIRRYVKIEPRVIIEIFEKSFRYMYKLVHKHIHSKEFADVHPVLRLEQIEMMWLGLSAYIRVLTRKQSMYKILLSSLRCKISSYKGKVNDLATLEYVTEDSHSSIFKKIRF